MNGTALTDPALADRVPMLVAIENNPIARPPSGLNLADIVIEAPVEGDTTRFGAVYMCTDEIGADVGPVRSGRYFNVDLWQQMRVLTVHFGAAQKVLNRFNGEGMPFVNGLTDGGPYFRRAGPWGAPHNVYVDVDLAREAMESGALKPAADRAGDARAPFTFGEDPEFPEGRAVSQVGIRTANIWHFGWQWDGASGLWLRTDAGAPNFERVTGDRISTPTVIVQIVRQQVLIGENDPGGYPRRQQFLVDSGAGVLYVGGRAHDVRWSRESKDDVTTWTYVDGGDEVVLPPGRLWWEIIPVGSGITES
ncbi:MAG TPA: DUF3048 domain-containing protein [Candidatus Limnocylindria bacterium]|nr:DUF3048 domain-containing protein [Candidatus Limnocylindria bacterium]